MAWQTGVAQSFDLIMYSGGVPTAPTGALAVTVSKDGVDFGAAGAGTSVAQIGATPAVHVVIGAADANVACGVVKIVDAGAAVDDRYETYTTEGNYTAAVAALIDAAISSRSTYAGGDTAGVTTLLSRATEARLAELDAANLPADVAAILADTGTNGVVVAAASKTGYSLTADQSGVTVGTVNALAAGERTSIATAVWASGARTLTGFGTLVADIWAHASAVAIKAATDALAAIMPGGVFTAASLVNAPGGGIGDFSIPLTVEDDAGDPVAGARMTIPGLSPQTSSALGAFDSEWPLSAGTYEVTILTGAGYTPSNPYTLVIAADGSVTTPTGGAFVVPLLALPLASDPDNIVLYNDETDDHGVALGDGDMTVQVVWIQEAGLNDADLLVSRSLLNATYDTDTSGRWSFEIPAAWATAGLVMRLEKTLTVAGAEDTQSVWLATLAEPALGESSVSWASLVPELYE